MKKNLYIGLTGGIGSGKSAVSRYLTGLGENVICADHAARQVVQPGEPGCLAIRRAFGDDFFVNDTLDRKKLAAHVFCDKKRLDLLNQLLHPLIVAYIFKQAAYLNGRVFIDAALLIQAGMHEKTDYVWLVVADMETRIQRVMDRDGLSRAQVTQRIGHQMCDEAMMAYADEVIDNSARLQDLHQKIDRLLSKPEYSEVRL